MSGNRKKTILRIGDDLRMLVDGGYKAELLLRKRGGIEGKYSLNDFMCEALFGYMGGGRGIQLLGIYDEEIAPGEKEERLKGEREVAKEVRLLEENEDWI